MKAGMTKNKPCKILKTLLRCYGSQRKIAKVIGIEPGSVSVWYRYNRFPPKHIEALVKHSNGFLTYKDFYSEENK